MPVTQHGKMCDLFIHIERFKSCFLKQGPYNKKCKCPLFSHRQLVSACYLGKWLGTRVQFPSVDVKLSPFVPEPPGVQQVAVVLDPALDTGVLQNVAW